MEYLAPSVFQHLVISPTGHQIITRGDIRFNCDCQSCNRGDPNPHLLTNHTGPTICKMEKELRKDNTHGCSQLMKAALYGDEKRFQEELERSSLFDVRQCDDHGSNGLLYSIGGRDKKFTSKFLRLGVKPNISNLWGLDGFLTAVLVNDLDSFVLLISMHGGMFTNFIYSDGDTVFHKVCRNENFKFAKLLCEHISYETVFTLNSSGRTAWQVWGDYSYKTSVIGFEARDEDADAQDEDEDCEARDQDDEARDDNIGTKNDLIAFLESRFHDLK